MTNDEKEDIRYMRKGGHGEDRYKSQSNIFRKIDSSKLCKLRISTGPKNQ